MFKIFTLAHQKIESYKLRSFSTIIISGIIFSIILTIVLITSGVKNFVFENAKNLPENEIKYLSVTFEKFDSSFIFPAIIILSIVALFIASFTLAHVLAEDRKSFMLYRSLGATAGQVSLIYLTYLLELCFYIIIFATALSLILTVVASLFFRNAIISSFTGFLVQTTNLPAIFIGFDSRFILVLISIFITAPLALLLNLDQLRIKKALESLKDTV